jgi:hypothetical protein
MIGQSASQEYASDEDGQEDNLEAKLAAVGAFLVGERDTFIQDRAASGVETQWREDLIAYQGRDAATIGADEMMARISVQGERGSRSQDDSMATRSRVVPNITRPKTNSAEARLADMLLPVDERNWGMKPTPVPEVDEMAQDRKTGVVQQGQPVMMDGENGPRQMMVADRAAEILAQARKAAGAMEKEIDDQHTEFDYNSVCRLVMHDAFVLGTGILKGPVVRAKTRKAWRPVTDGQRTVHVLQMTEEKRPISEVVSPWDFFPDMSCGTDIQNSSAVWERQRITARKLRDLAKAPGYIAEHIRAAIVEGPKTSYVAADRDRETNFWQPPEDRQFELWERHGDLEMDVFQMCGCDTSGMDPLMSISGCVVLLNGRVIKAYINPLDTGDLIYDVFALEPAQNRVFGYGVPYMLRQCAQRMLTAAVRQIMDNGGLTAGPQIVANRKTIIPANGRWEITGRKLWWMTEEGQAEHAFKTYDIPSNIEEFLKIIDLALKFADEEIAFPMIMSGERGSAPEQVGSMQMLMNAATVVLRRLVKRYDDYVTKRHVRRYYDWNMQYSPKQEIKGDYEVDARGSTALMQRDIQNQALQKWLAALSNPALEWYFDADKLIKKALQADYITPDDVMPDDAELARRKDARAKQQPTPSPDAIVRAEAALKSAQMREQGEMQRAGAELQDAAAEREHEMMIAAIEGDIAMREMMQSKGINLDKLKASLATQVMKIRADREAQAQGATTLAVT